MLDSVRETVFAVDYDGGDLLFTLSDAHRFNITRANSVSGPLPSNNFLADLFTFWYITKRYQTAPRM